MTSPWEKANKSNDLRLLGQPLEALGIFPWQFPYTEKPIGRKRESNNFEGGCGPRNLLICQEREEQIECQGSWDQMRFRINNEPISRVPGILQRMPRISNAPTHTHPLLRSNQASNMVLSAQMDHCMRRERPLKWVELGLNVSLNPFPTGLT